MVIFTKNYFRKLKIVYVLILLIFIQIMISGSIGAQGEKKVLILHSYHQSLSWTGGLNRGIETILLESEIDMELYYEYMDLKRINLPYDKLADLYSYKYRNLKFDLIIATDNHALNFLFLYRDRLFPGVPVVFAGINGFKDYMLEGRPLYTGVAEEIDFKDTIDTVLKLHPHTDQVIIYGDNTLTYQINKDGLKTLIPLYRDQIVFSFREGLTLSAIIEDIKSLPEGSIILLISTIEDDDGEIIPYKKIPEILSKNSSVPIYGLWDFFLGQGIVGGKLVCGRAQGREAGQLGLMILRGQDIEEIPVVKEGFSRYMFDYRELERFGIDLSLLPENSVIINRPVSFLEKYRDVLGWALLVLFVLLGAIIYLFKNNIKQRLIKEEFFREKQYRQRIIDTAEALIVSLNPEAEILTFNRFAEKITGYKREEVVGKNWYDIFAPEGGRKKGLQVFQKILNADRAYHQNANPLVDREGEEHFISWQNSCLRDEEGKVESVIAIGIDITDQKKAERDLQFHIYHDALTDLCNMNFFRERFDIELDIARRKGFKLAVLLLDLDRFKLINDIYGHKTGDEVLRVVAGRLEELLGEEICLARMGGDEFIALLPDFTGIESLINRAETILNYIKEPIMIEDEEFVVESSMGIALFPDDGDTVEILIKNADTALMRAKEGEKGTYRLYNNEMNIHISNRLDLERGLRKALERDELLVYYQPVIDIKTGRISRAEALVRWDKPGEGLVSPAKFIPLAEENGLIVPIGNIVLKKACQQARRWSEMGYRDLKVSVNLSARQFSSLDLEEEIDKVLVETGLDRSQLALELTESVAVQNFELTVNTLKRFRKMGMEVYLDDFGSGYSSLNYLTKFPLDVLKIDRFFVSSLEQVEQNPAIVAAIIAMAHELGLKVVAEGVEDSDQLDFLKAHGCDYAQGYYFSKPLPEQEFIKLLQEEGNY